MAEHFHGRDHTVHFSNGATEILYSAWIMLGEPLSTTPEHEAVLAWLRRLVYERGNGMRQFSLDPPPTEIAAPERLRFLAMILAAFAAELAQQQPTITVMEMDWHDRDLRLSWLARVIDLYDMLAEAMPSDATPIRALELNMVESDRIDCEIHRLLDRKSNLVHDKNKREQRGLEQADNYSQKMLSLIERIVALAKQDRQQAERVQVLASVLVERADLFLDQGLVKEALDTLLEASSLLAPYPDLAELRRTNEEYRTAVMKIYGLEA